MELRDAATPEPGSSASEPAALRPAAPDPALRPAAPDPALLTPGPVFPPTQDQAPGGASTVDIDLSGHPGPARNAGKAAQVEPGPVRYRVDTRFAVIKVVATVILALVTIGFTGDPTRTAFTAVAALLCAGYAARDLIAPVRVAADTDGVTMITGYASRHRLAWSDIDLVRLDQRRRYGTRSEFLEIDAGEELHLYSVYDLGVPPSDAVDALLALSDQRTVPQS